MVNAMGLGVASAYLNIVGKACLRTSAVNIIDMVSWLIVPSWQHAKTLRFHCLARVLGCFPVSRAAKIGQRRPSYGRSCLVAEQALWSIGMARDQHRTPCRHG